MDLLRDNIPTGYCFPRKFSPLKFEGVFLIEEDRAIYRRIYMYTIVYKMLV